MADDARISTALPRHPKTVKLKRRLGADGFCSLICLFLWVAENRPIGDLTGMSAEDIEIAADWSGHTGEFVSTLAEVRFLDGEQGAYKIHDWAEHNPYAANRPARVAQAKAAANKLWKKKRAACDEHAPSMLPACDEHDSAMPPSLPLHSPPLHSPPGAKSKACARPARPTLEEVAAYCRERGNQVDPQKFFDHYESNGWMVGRNPMKDWQAAVRTWETNEVNHEKGVGHANPAQQREAEHFEAASGAVEILRRRGMAS
jgi:hypothetical protein